MKINSSSLVEAATHTAADSVEVQERLVFRRAAASAPATAAASAPAVSGTATPMDGFEIFDPKMVLAQWLYRYFTGRDLPLVRVPQRGPAGGAATAATQVSGAPAAVTPAPWKVSYTRRDVHHEAESTSFSAEGKVTLQSGKTVEFSLKLDMNRELTEINTVTLGDGKASDPIAVNLDGAGVRLTSHRQAFDLNGDGMDETIATLAAGSAWLAQDVNGNGKVDSGRELFGPRSGDGFGELAALDQDHNGWIDEGDAGYGRLGVWSDGKFSSLRDAGIGAISVAVASTPFALKEGSELLGQVRKSGVYLREDGTAGALQQVDLKV
jgi:hypothetical protein